MERYTNPPHLFEATALLNLARTFLGRLSTSGCDWDPPTICRFMEHKGELDNIRFMYARMQAQLDETHKLLHEEHRKRFQ